MMTIRPAVMTVSVILAGLAGPQPSPAQRARFDLDALRALVRIHQVSLAPDGSRILTIVSRPDYDANRHRPELLVLDPANGTSRVLSRGRVYLAGARWSPSGDRIAFLAPKSDESRSAQVWLLPTDGGEARRITDAPRGVERFAWRPDGRALAFATEDEPLRREGEERNNDSFEIGEDDYLIRGPAMSVHLWIVADTGGTATRITGGTWSLAKADAASELSFSATGERIAFASQETAHSGAFGRAVIRVTDLSGGGTRIVGRGFGTDPAFSPDGKEVMASRPRGSVAYFGSHGLVAIDLATGAERWLTERLDRNFSGGDWLPDGRVLVSTQDGTRTRAWILARDGTPLPLDLGEIDPAGSLSSSADGAIAFAGGSPTEPPEIYYLAPGGNRPKRLTSFGAELARYEMARSEGVEWEVEKGIRADGVLTYPPGSVAGTRHPLVVWFHGGPMGASTVAFSERIQLLAAQGWLVLQPNYRGSTNRGDAFQSAIIGDAGDGPGRDAMAGIRSLIRRGLVDTTRMAVAGWSYGGFMTTWMIGHYPGWRAAVAGAAVTDHADSYNLSDIGVTYGNAWGGPLWTDRFEALARAQSPITYYRAMTTPTLILSNTGDVRVPIVESFKLYRALKDRGVPVRFVAYPIGGHVPGDPVRSRDVYRRVIDWIGAAFEGRSLTSP